MRSTILGDSKDDRAQFDRLLRQADVFFANKRPGFLKKHGLDAEELCAQKPGLIHATVVLHGEKGPWSNRPGFDEIGAAVSGLFALEGTPTRPKQPVIVPIADKPDYHHQNSVRSQRSTRSATIHAIGREPV